MTRVRRPLKNETTQMIVMMKTTTMLMAVMILNMMMMVIWRASVPIAGSHLSLSAVRVPSSHCPLTSRPCGFPPVIVKNAGSSVLPLSIYINIYTYTYIYIVRVPTCHCRLTARKLLSAIFSPTTSVVVTIIAESDPRIVVKMIPVPLPSVRGPTPSSSPPLPLFPFPPSPPHLV